MAAAPRSYSSGCATSSAAPEGYCCAPCQQHQRRCRRRYYERPPPWARPPHRCSPLGQSSCASPRGRKRQRMAAARRAAAASVSALVSQRTTSCSCVGYWSPLPPTPCHMYEPDAARGTRGTRSLSPPHYYAHCRRRSSCCRVRARGPHSRMTRHSASRPSAIPLEWRRPSRRCCLLRSSRSPFYSRRPHARRDGSACRVPLALVVPVWAPQPPAPVRAHSPSCLRPSPASAASRHHSAPCQTRAATARWPPVASPPHDYATCPSRPSPSRARAGPRRSPTARPPSRACAAPRG